MNHLLRILPLPLLLTTALAQTPPNIRATSFCPNYAGGKPPLGPAGVGTGAFRKVTLTAPNAVCNDGTQAAIYVRAARVGATEPDGPSANRWVIHIEGGGGCSNFQDCLVRWCGLGFYTAARMSSSLYSDSIGHDGLLGRNDINQLGDRNLVLIKYCSSDSWSGRASNVVYTNPDNSSQAFSLNFQGANIIAAAFDALEAGVSGLPRLTAATDVLVSGDSAGATGVRLHLDRIAARLRAVNPAIRVRGALEATFAPDFNGKQGAPAGDPADPAYARATATFNSVHVPRNVQLDDSCLAAHPGAPYLCIDAGYLEANHITTPFFQIQDLADPNLMENYEGTGLVFTPASFAQYLHDQTSALVNLRTTALERSSMTQNPGVAGRLCAVHVMWGEDDGFLGRKLSSPNGRAYSFYELLWNWMQGAQPSVLIEPKPPLTPDNPVLDSACSAKAPNASAPRTATASSASYDFQAPVAPESIAVTFGTNLAGTTSIATSIPWPATLGGVQITVRDSNNTTRQAPIYFVSPGQVLYLIPAGTVPGTAEVTIGTQRFSVEVAATSPSIYTANQRGTGVAAGTFVRVRNGQQTAGLLFDPSTNSAVPIGAKAGDQIYLILYGTGMRGGAATTTVGGVSVPAAGPVAQSQYPGLDQINLGPLPLKIGEGLKEIVIRQGERVANSVNVVFRAE